ncbi:hypothetical protein JCM10449v2_007519 [Rhodotorula kratochvilovae]
MPTGIQDLPFELIEHVLDLASRGYDLDSAKSAAARSLYLRECSLVSRQWRAPAQACLWASLRIHSPATAKKVLGSPVLGMYGTRELDLAGVHAGHEGLSGTTAARLLGKIKGVRWLRLADFGRLSARVLQHDNLAGLKTLLLMTSFPDKPATIAALRIPFHLRTLHLFNRSYANGLLPTLFAASSHSLSSLTLLTGSGSPSYAALVSAFPLVAPNLVHLSLQHRPSPLLTSSFALLTRLTHLECHFAVDLASVLDALPPTGTLETLALELDYNLADISTLLLRRLAAAPALSSLRALRIPRAPHRDEFAEFGGGELLRVCAERGVKVEIGETVAWRTRMFTD